MSDQFALGLLAKMVESLEQKVEALTIRVEELEMQGTEDEEPQFYMDGTRIK